jgi:hypothetical protein
MRKNVISRRPAAVLRGALLLTLMAGAAATAPTASAQMRFTEVYTVGGTPGPRSDVFSDQSVHALGPAGRLYVGDTPRGTVRVFDTSGRLVLEFGSEGTAAGSFTEISSLHFDPTQNALFVHDAARDRVSVFSPAGRLLRIVELSIETRKLRMYVHGSGALLFVGSLSRAPGSLVHVTDSSGRYIRSFAELLGATHPPRLSPDVREQLTQGSLTELSGGDVIVALRAPYVVGRFSITGVRRWLVRDAQLPEPWRQHVVESPQSFRVRPYPSVTAVQSLGGDLFQIRTADFESGSRSADIRSTRDGRLSSRRSLPFSPYVATVQPDGGHAGGRAVIVSSKPHTRFIVSDWSLNATSSRR